MTFWQVFCAICAAYWIIFLIYAHGTSPSAGKFSCLLWKIVRLCLLLCGGFLLVAMAAGSSSKD